MSSHLAGSICSTSLWMSTLGLISARPSQTAVQAAFNLPSHIIYQFESNLSFVCAYYFIWNETPKVTPNV